MMQDFGHATGNDSVGNKDTMPEVMQVKKFGFRSQVKWTHLTKEDTSSKDAMWASDHKITSKMQGRTAGHKGANDFDRPAAKRKKQA